MRIFWEKVGLLAPIYRLVGQGFSDRDIAEKLNLAEIRVQDCVAWILHFLGFTDRTELVRFAAAPVVREATIVAGQLQLRIAANLSN
jgi:hypothetical protein